MAAGRPQDGARQGLGQHLAQAAGDRIGLTEQRGQPGGLLGHLGRHHRTKGHEGLLAGTSRRSAGTAAIFPSRFRENKRGPLTAVEFLADLHLAAPACGDVPDGPADVALKRP